MLAKQELIEIFPNIDGMIQLSDMILIQFQAVFAKWNSKTTKIGQEMAFYAQSLKIYSDFFNSYMENADKLKGLRSKFPQRTKEI